MQSRRSSTGRYKVHASWNTRAKLPALATLLRRTHLMYVQVQIELFRQFRAGSIHEAWGLRYCSAHKIKLCHLHQESGMLHNPFWYLRQLISRTANC